ncbi:dethiobiotin synthase [Sulfurivirga caldicuralii]|uniref:ATP-dependent dethiobiotin synthetase BioD n=1 Tax=Sulfurivirga caldicuralii TaxID=364032 RepID=A0A1N6GVJ5_9GAMM|nr:dethiobiotin synthase [Sulfurivirga caldicuralii]SIO11536.1 dethiobiotin synthase [Sulfurivirga caldicuralii]
MTELPKRGLFVTGTDTDVGKTWVSQNLLKSLKNPAFSGTGSTGKKPAAEKVGDPPPVSARKPVASGAQRTRRGLWAPDTLALADATGEPLQRITPYTFEPPISPAEAARQAGCDTSLEKLIDACRVPERRWTLVEGAGGFYSPLGSDGSLNADLAEALGLPVLLVVAHRLGCINHTLLTLEAIERRGLKLAGVVLNDGPLPVENSPTPQELKRYLKEKPLWHCGPQRLDPALSAWITAVYS